MVNEFELILEGKYNYLKEKQTYCEENFKVMRQGSSRGDFIFNAEVLSRSHTGEFLKIEVSYLVSHDFYPKKVVVKRFMGGRESCETFDIEGVNKSIEYFFFDGSDTHQSIKPISGNFQIATPAFSTSMLMTLKKKLDSVHRTHYTVISSENIWSYKSPLFDKDIYIELIELNPISLKIADINLKATHCAILESNEAGSNRENSDQMFLSKHFSIPYKGVFAGDTIIEIAHMKVLEDKFSKMF